MQNYIARLNWLLALFFIVWIFFLPSSCREKKEATHHKVSDDSATLYLSGATFTENGGTHPMMALCIKDARALPNSVVYCDSLINTIYIGTLDRIIHVYDSLHPMEWRVLNCQHMKIQLR